MGDDTMFQARQPEQRAYCIPDHDCIGIGRKTKAGARRDVAVRLVENSQQFNRSHRHGSENPDEPGLGIADVALPYPVAGLLGTGGADS